MKSYVIADLDAIPDEDRFFRSVSDVSAAGVDFIQLRAKRLEGSPLMRAAERCRAIIPAGGARFLVNGRPDIALAAGADGVHLPSDGMPVAAARTVGPDLMVGRSCHSLTESRIAHREGADYILLGPVFHVRSKSAEPSVSLEDLRTAAAHMPTFALGGLSLELLPELAGAGLAGVAAITMFLIDRPLEPIVRAVREL